MSSSTLRSTRIGALAGRSPLLRLQSDERLVALIRGEHQTAFELLFRRYRSRLLAFCRHMLSSKEDAEDVLQEVFAAAYNAMRADERELNVRPWLYRIARNRCLNHLRRPKADPQESMDDYADPKGASAADLVHKRADFRHLLEDVQKLPETQRTALLLREIDSLSYDQISEAMETTMPSVKSLLVRARMSLAEAAEARTLTCDDVRRQLAEVSEGLKKMTPPLRKHVRDCEQCHEYRAQLRKTGTTMAMVFPVGLIFTFKKLVLAKLGSAAAAGSTAGGGAAGGGAAGSGAAAGGLAAGGASTAVPAGLSAVATKAIAGIAATAVIAGGAVEVEKITSSHSKPKPVPANIVEQSGPETGGEAINELPVPLTDSELQAAGEAPDGEETGAIPGDEGPDEDPDSTDDEGAEPAPDDPTPGESPEDTGTAPGDSPDDSDPDGDEDETDSGGAELPSSGANGSQAEPEASSSQAEPKPVDDDE